MEIVKALVDGTRVRIEKETRLFQVANHLGFGNPVVIERGRESARLQIF
jgi:hypothetical protein